jgi:hypothetical protein
LWNEGMIKITPQLNAKPSHLVSASISDHDTQGTFIEHSSGANTVLSSSSHCV